MNPSDEIEPMKIKKMRKDFIKCIMKDEEYKKKDEKKKEIVKYCKSYKDFCNIVSSVNMKPIKTYEEKVSYEDYINMKFPVSTFKMEYIKKKNAKNRYFLLPDQSQINNQMEKSLPQEIQAYKSKQKIHQFLNVLWNHQKDYGKFIKSNYNSDELTELLCLMSRNWDDLFDIKIQEEDLASFTSQLKLPNLVNFLTHMVKHWEMEGLSFYFTQEELKDINVNLQDVIHKIEKKISSYSYDNHQKCEETIKMINYLKAYSFLN
ncbi:hypothetical protein, conserved [Plasmodium gonderi]|uniref:Dynein attachment factor N-terminal domain-containing protein n=1 Tax=Plasmodium gonderi TaxID=77519 RepID=A0A1Y1JJ31_PLAGO|nr:hypothetical protein, conserved [Plasmodium gonderi]GAW80463.1 hypothetical protein, conserved [Plasmodium gonderi]